MSYTEQLERETERTRMDLANTVEELRERLTPGEVLDEVIDYASDGDVGTFLRNFRRQVVDNPLPLGLMGVGVAWLMAASGFGGGRNDRKLREASAAMRDRAAREAGDVAADARDAGRTFADHADDMRARAADQAADIARHATDQMATVAGQASEAAARAGDRMRSAASAAEANLAAVGDRLTDSARGGAQAIGDAATEIARSSRTASRAMIDFGREQPLLVTATGIILGAIIGALLPSTEIEDQLVGESSDAAKDKLRELAGEQYAKAKDAAVRTAEAALDESGATASSSHDRAEGHGSREFGPGPGDHDAQHASGDPTSGTEEAEHTRAGGT
jgi:hypothetical protein